MSDPQPTVPAPANPMPDVQGSDDLRHVPIDKVGVKDIRYPITLDTPGGGKQSTVATVNMY
ncbi:MAG: GTP cyclohydrolase, FolE2/MptA family, partial [Planctomycetota bacterium]